MRKQVPQTGLPLSEGLPNLLHGVHTHVIRQDAAFALAVLPEHPAHAVPLRDSKHKRSFRVLVLLQPQQTSYKTD